VEQGDAAFNLSGADPGAALALQSHGDKVFVAKAAADRDGAGEDLAGRPKIFVADGAHGLRQQQVSLFDAVFFFGEQAIGTRKPAAGLRMLTAEECGKSKPEGAPGGGSCLVPIEEELVGAGEVAGAFGLAADEVSDLGQLLQLFGFE